MNKFILPLGVVAFNLLPTLYKAQKHISPDHYNSNFSEKHSVDLFANVIATLGSVLSILTLNPAYAIGFSVFNYTTAFTNDFKEERTNMVPPANAFSLCAGIVLGIASTFFADKFLSSNNLLTNTHSR